MDLKKQLGKLNDAGLSFRTIAAGSGVRYQQLLFFMRDLKNALEEHEKEAIREYINTLADRLKKIVDDE